MDSSSWILASELTLEIHNIPQDLNDHPKQIPIGLFNTDMSTLQYTNKKDETVLWPSYHYNGIPHNDKTLSFYTHNISLTQCKTVASPLLMHWRYCNLARSSWFDLTQNLAFDLLSGKAILWMYYVCCLYQWYPVDFSKMTRSDRAQPSRK